jgi:hypothetical protein
MSSNFKQVLRDGASENATLRPRVMKFSTPWDTTEIVQAFDFVHAHDKSCNSDGSSVRHGLRVSDSAMNVCVLSVQVHSGDIIEYIL